MSRTADDENDIYHEIGGSGSGFLRYSITSKIPAMLVIIFAVFAGCFLLERLIAGWKLPAVPTWTIRVLAVNFA